MSMHLTLMGNASRGLPRNGLVGLYDPYRDAYGLAEAPRLALQTAVDYSGRANNLTYGATTNASTDDPVNTGTAWSFDGGDFLTTPDLGNGDLTAYTVFKFNETITGPFPGVWGRNNIALDLASAANNIDFVYRDSATNTSKNLRISSISRNTWYLAVCRASAAGMWGFSITSIGTLEASGFTLKADFTTYGDFLGQYYTYPMEGLIAYHAMYNWVHPDGLAMRCRNSIKSLMASRGVTVA